MSDLFNIESYSYQVDPMLIAQEPLSRRDESRLFVCGRTSDYVRHRIFHRVIEEFRAGDLLVLNESQVIPARLMIEHRSRQIECLVIGWANGRAKILVKNARRFKPGDELLIAGTQVAKVLGRAEAGSVLIDFGDQDLRSILDKRGFPPLPPYIKREPGSSHPQDRERYQTVYANPNRSGSIAAPTAGLHFTAELLDRALSIGVIIVKVALQVGLGTFRPIQSVDIRDHQMHSERVTIEPEVRDAIIRAKKEGRRVIAVGTTSVRAIESAFLRWAQGDERPSFETELYIVPGFRFQGVDALITNFHQPRSTLIAMVAAFLGNPARLLAYYSEAARERYRFFSYGDAMFIS